MDSTRWSEVSNPFDFANPIRAQNLFVGRQQLLDEIDYYLRHAQRSKRPINLAVIGPRAAGKTSLLNMIEHRASDKQCLPTRIDLDESDAVSQLAFFHKVFDGLFNTACSAGAFGGLAGKTYETYLEVVDACEIPTDRTFCPFAFPLQYARATREGRVSAPVSDVALKKDFALIASEAKRTQVLLFDECDVLAQCRPHLQKLRNLFMATDGYMLVLAGTDALFPVIDEVFSPIIRQFKKLHVGPFGRSQDTRDCIERALKSVGVSDPADLCDVDTSEEVHRSSGGRPYEIQLMCHVMFRRLQEGQARKMQWTLAVLEDVRRELEATQDVSRRDVLGAIRRLEPRELEALNLLCSCAPGATLDQLWFIEHGIAARHRWTHDELSALAGSLQERGVIAGADAQLEFLGDEFDKVYTRYFARERGVALGVGDFTVERLMTFTLDSSIGREAPAARGGVLGRDLPPDEGLVDKALSGLASVGGGENVFDSIGSVASSIYWLVVRHRERATVELFTVNLRSPWMNLKRQYVCATVNCGDGHGGIEGALQRLDARVTALGGAVEVSRREIVLPSLATARLVLRGAENEVLRRRIASEHVDEVIESYVRKRDVLEAQFHAESAREISPSWSAMNNLGYLLLVQGRNREADETLQIAEVMAKEPSDRALTAYNRAIAVMKNGDCARAETLLRNAIDELEGSDEGWRAVSCLVVPISPASGEGVQFEEVADPNLLAAARRALEFVRPTSGGMAE